jgi:hypothetical protein
MDNTAAVITAAAGLLIALAGVITALVSLIPVLRSVRRIDESQANITELVNGNHHVALARIDQLKESLSDAGVTIPKSPPGGQAGAP